jgi:hypothetical protein
MKLNGDPQGIEVLKELSRTKMDWVKYVITEAKTNFDHTSHFKSESGKKYKLIYDPQNGEFNIEVES